jgi:hypothetical protein
MNRTRKHTVLIILGLTVMMMLGVTANAFAWGYATHAHIDDQLLRDSGQLNRNEIYGGMTPDIFNYLFDLPYQQDLYALTHYDFTKVWNSADNLRDKAVAFGFVSHNDMWGADATAHHAGITFGQDEGYVIAKARLVKAFMETYVPEYQALNIPDDAAIMIFHELVEEAVDLRITEQDPEIGYTLALAALTRKPNATGLLVRAFSADIAGVSGMSTAEAELFIKQAEAAFRNRMIFYGWALAQDRETAIQMLAEQTGGLAENFLALYGITLPPDTDLTPLIAYAIGVSVDLCDDYEAEIDATRHKVKRELKARGITY